MAGIANAGGSRSAELAVFPALGGRTPHDAPKKGPRPVAAPQPPAPLASTMRPRHVVEASAVKKTEPQKVLFETGAFNIILFLNKNASTTYAFKQEMHLASAAAHGADDHEGRSERPPAALLLLVLGQCPVPVQPDIPLPGVLANRNKQIVFLEIVILTVTCYS